MSSTYGEHIKLTIFGQSHGPAIGMTLDGVPAGLSVDIAALQAFMDRRAPGQNTYSTKRKEPDIPTFLSGLVNGYTCGAPICAIITNTNTRSADYENLNDRPRPGHADYTAQIKYGGHQDVAGGGHFSGRLTAPLCIAGGMCKQWLESRGIQIAAHIKSIASVQDRSFDAIHAQLVDVQSDFPVLDHEAGLQMQEAIAEAKANGNSVGGIIECAVTGLPVGLGDPMFGGMESRIAQIVYGIPAVKGVSFGLGFEATMKYGSENNDPYTISEDRVVTVTNNCGGILGGITNGMPLIFHTAIKPTPSIAIAQQSISISNMTEQMLQVNGRHDPCIVPRAVPVIEAAAAIAIFDSMLVQEASKWN